jgi:hypothetical protein
VRLDLEIAHQRQGAPNLVGGVGPGSTPSLKFTASKLVLSTKQATKKCGTSSRSPASDAGALWPPGREQDPALSDGLPSAAHTPSVSEEEESEGGRERELSESYAFKPRLTRVLSLVPQRLRARGLPGPCPPLPHRPRAPPSRENAGLFCAAMGKRLTLIFQTVRKWREIWPYPHKQPSPFHPTQNTTQTTMTSPVADCRRPTEEEDDDTFYLFLLKQ